MGKSFWERQDNGRENFLKLTAEITEVPVPRNLWTLEGKGVQENELLFKDSLLKPRGQFIPTSRKSGKIG